MEILEILSKEMQSMVLAKQAELNTNDEISNKLEKTDSGISNCSSKPINNTDVQVSEENGVKTSDMKSDPMMTYQCPRGGDGVCQTQGVQGCRKNSWRDGKYQSLCISHA